MERQWSGNVRRLSRLDRSEIERRIWRGETFEMVATAVGCSTKSIQRFMALTGGLKPRRQRSPLRLSASEREEISRGLTAGHSLRRIAGRLKRAPSTISREIAWNGTRRTYRAWRAEESATRRAQRPKPEKLAVNLRLCRAVERGLRAYWSPQQIAAQLISDYPDDLEMRCRTKRSTNRCSSRAAEPCGRSLPPAFEQAGRSGVRGCVSKNPVPAEFETWC